MPDGGEGPTLLDPGDGTQRDLATRIGDDGEHSEVLNRGSVRSGGPHHDVDVVVAVPVRGGVGARYRGADRAGNLRGGQAQPSGLGAVDRDHHFGASKLEVVVQ